MPEPTQFSITHKELVELIIKNAGIHEGRWVLSVAFAFAPGNFGPVPEQMVPGTIVGISQVGIQRETPEMMAPSSLVVDASVINPVQKRETQPARRHKGEKS